MRFKKGLMFLCFQCSISIEIQQSKSRTQCQCVFKKNQIRKFGNFLVLNIRQRVLIIIMIIKSIKLFQSFISRARCATSQAKPPKYTPPASQFETFKKHLENIDNSASRKEAAELLARLESDEEIYKEKLIELDREFKEEEKENSLLSDIFKRTTLLQQQIDEQIEENKDIENRCYKTIDHNKIYGISRISKEVIETADHIKEAIRIVEASNAENKVSQLSQLTRLQAELLKTFGKYEIHEFNPINELFNPNEHESISFIETQEAEKKNQIAEVKRTGFKLKEMLLRSAYVIIYK